jgi:hypothetical protein
MYIVYLTTNLVNGKLYLGYHKCTTTDPEKDKYLGSGRVFKKALTKYGKSSFKRKILATFDKKEEATNFEELLLGMVNAGDNKRYYNRHNFSQGGLTNPKFGRDNPFFGKQHTAETKLIISQAKTGISLTNEHKAKVSASLIGNTRSRTKEYLITDPSGNTHTTSSVRDFCKLYTLNQTSMSRVVRGLQPQHKGYTGYIIKPEHTNDVL